MARGERSPDVRREFTDKNLARLHNELSEEAPSGALEEAGAESIGRLGPVVSKLLMTNGVQRSVDLLLGLATETPSHDMQRRLTGNVGLALAEIRRPLPALLETCRVDNDQTLEEVAETVGIGADQLLQLEMGTSAVIDAQAKTLAAWIRAVRVAIEDLAIPALRRSLKVDHVRSAVYAEADSQRAKAAALLEQVEQELGIARSGRQMPTPPPPERRK